jgi:hypothetical protein
MAPKTIPKISFQSNPSFSDDELLAFLSSLVCSDRSPRSFNAEPALLDSFELEDVEFPPVGALFPLEGPFPVGGLELGLLLGAFPVLVFGLDAAGFGLDGAGLGLDGAGLGLDGAGLGLGGAGLGLLGGFDLGPSLANPHCFVAVLQTHGAAQPKRSQFEVLDKHKPKLGPSVKQPRRSELQNPTFSQFLSISMHCPW